jgi:hypothetical protein
VFHARNGRFAGLGVLGAAALFLGLLFVGLLPAAHAAGSGLITCSTTLTGANEVPPTRSTATGTVSYSFDSLTAMSTWSVTFAGLTNFAIAAHVHAPALPGSNAAVVVPLTTIPAATSGSYSGSATTTFPTTSEPSAAQYATDLLAGKAYANIHTVIYPGGEIRGWLSCTQASPVPEFSPTMGALALAAMLFPLAAGLRRIRS